MARKLKASLPELKFQVSVLVVCVPLRIAVGVTEEKLRRVALDNFQARCLHQCRDYHRVDRSGDVISRVEIGDSERTRIGKSSVGFG